MGLCALVAMAEPGIRAEDDRIIMETDHLVYEIGTDGMNRAFVDRRASKDRSDDTDVGPFMAVEKDGQWFGATAVQPQRGFLFVTFAEVGIVAKIHARAFPNYLTFELTSLNDHSISRIQLLRLAVNITKTMSVSIAHCRDDEFAVAAIPLNIETLCYTAPWERAVPGQPLPGLPYKDRSHVLPTGGRHPALVGAAEKRVRLEGAKIAVTGCPTQNLLDIIEQVEIENGLPHPMLGGVWARRAPDMIKSYLYVGLSEAIADEMIDYAKAGGFGYIVIHTNDWHGCQGSYPVNRRNFPSGRAGLKAVSDKIHAAGLKFGMHNLDMVVAKNDALVHPVPERGFMMYPGRRRDLAANIGPADSFIPTTISPRGLMKKGDKSRYHGRDLRIGDEIIVYAELQTTEPFGFKGCRRGARGTVAAAHLAGSVIDNFAEFINYYLPDVKGPLYDRVARNQAKALDDYGFDYIYSDGVGENLNNWPEEEGPKWYIKNLAAFKLYHYTKREVMMGHGPVSNFSWHIHTRGNTVDSVRLGIIDYFDRLSVASSASCANALVPFEFGWFGYYTHSEQGEASRPREMEYAWCKALAYGAAMSLETYKDALDGNGRTPEIFARIKQWEELKLSGYFPDRIRERLKAPGDEFALEQKSENEWCVRPVKYGPDRYVGKVDGQENVWSFRNTHPTQPLRVFIQPKPQLAEYGDRDNVVLLEPGPLKLNTVGAGPMGEPRQSPGFEYALRPADEAPPSGGKSFVVSAINKGTREAGWGCAEVILDKTLDLTQHRALGTWVKGDGSGAYLHFTVESGRWTVRDFYVRLDFAGWKYVRMPEPAQAEVYDFHFPYSNYWSIRIIDYSNISRVYVFITNLAPGAKASALFGRLEALKEDPRSIDQPGLTVNGEPITFPVTLGPDWYLEYEGSGRARVFDPNGFTKVEVEPQGAAPTIRSGENEVTFFCARGQGRGEAAKVTVITRGEPLH